MGTLKTLEDKLGEVFNGLPAMPKNAKNSLVNAWPWIALVFGVLQLAAAYWLWRLTRVVEVLDAFSRYLSGSNALSAGDKTMIYLGVVMLLVDAVVLLMAFPKLQARKKAGWDLLFLGTVLNVAYAVFSIFINGRGMGSFLSNLIGSAIGFYLLFQVRDYYKD